MNIWQDFLINDGPVINKWRHYFPIYERHLTSWRNKTITILEIGVDKGGSLQMWQRFFGPMATIVGIDLNPESIEAEQDGIHVRIGDQSSPEFLSTLIEEFGPFDIVIDDGSHMMEHMLASFNFLYPTLSKNGLYIIEDTHTCYWPEFGGGVDNPNTFINISKNHLDELNSFHARDTVPETFISKHTFGIYHYDSVIVYERGTIPLRKGKQTGEGAIIY